MGTIFNVLLSPKQTFERIRENGGAFLIPLIVFVAVSFIAAILQIPVIEKAVDMTDMDQAGVSPETIKKIAVISSLVMTPIMIAAMVFITGLLLLLVNLIVRGEANYMQLVKVGILSSIPGLINGLLVGILARTTDAQSINELSISLGALLEKKEGFIFGLANIVNPFGLWGLAIMVIGTAVMARKSASSVGIWVVAGWLLFNIPFAFFV